MPEHIFEKEASNKSWTVKISPSTDYGYFEHKTLGDEASGGLWFEDNELVDYDGLPILTPGVTVLIESLGYIVPALCKF